MKAIIMQNGPRAQLLFVETVVFQYISPYYSRYHANKQLEHIIGLSQESRSAIISESRQANLMDELLIMMMMARQPPKGDSLRPNTRTYRIEHGGNELSFPRGIQPRA